MDYQKETTYWLTVNVQGKSPGPFAVTYAGRGEFLGELHHSFNLKDHFFTFSPTESQIGPGLSFQIDDEPPDTPAPPLRKSLPHF